MAFETLSLEDNKSLRVGVITATCRAIEVAFYDALIAHDFYCVFSCRALTATFHLLRPRSALSIFHHILLPEGLSWPALADRLRSCNKSIHNDDSIFRNSSLPDSSIIFDGR